MMLPGQAKLIPVSLPLLTFRQDHVQTPGNSSYAIEAAVEPKVSFEAFRTGCSLATVEAAFNALKQVDFGSFEFVSSAFKCTQEEHNACIVPALCRAPRSDVSLRS